MEKTMPQNLKRVSVMLKNEQHDHLVRSEINASGLIRDLLDDYFSEHKITIAVSEETRKLYDLIMANTGSSDEELENYLRESLKKLLSNKIKYMQKLEKGLK